MRGMSMNPANRRVLLCGTWFLFLYLGSALALQGNNSNANLNCTGVINTRAVSALSIDEISRLGEAISLPNDFGGLIFRPFDEDDRPRRGKEIEIGFILARSGDLGGTPVGLIVWSGRNLNFTFRKTPEGAISVESSDLRSCHILTTFAFSKKGYIQRDTKVIAQAR